MASWETQYKTKLMSAQEAIRLIKTGGPRVFVGSGCSVPQGIVTELVSGKHDILDGELYQYLTFGTAPIATGENSKKFRTVAFYAGQNLCTTIQAGDGDYLPVTLSEISSLFAKGRIPLDAAVIQVSPPDANGFVSFGVSIDIVKSAVQNAVLVIAEVNKNVPRTQGDTLLSLDMIDAIVESSDSLVERTLPDTDHVSEAIANNVAQLIDDGATIQPGLGDIPQMVLRFLSDKKDIGIHTEMITDEIVSLIEKGIVNGKRKSINRGKVIASCACGTKKLYTLIHENQTFEFRPAEYVADPFVISQNARFIAINQAHQIDMTGQVVFDSIGYDFCGGLGGAVDFSRGALRSKGGKSIIVLPSRSSDGKSSRIVASLPEGSGVALNRADVHYVVTEYGIADLEGKSIRERVVALAEIAHPDFRDDILKQAKARKYVFSDQLALGGKTVQYPREIERFMPLSDGTELFFRPIRVTDEKIIRDMLYGCSERSIAFRFFKPIKSFPHRFVQEFTNVDYSKDMVVIAVVQETGGDQVVALSRYTLNPETNRAEISFLVRDDWQSKGIGTYLFDILIEVAKKRGVKGCDANVVGENPSMLAVFYNTGFKISTQKEGENFKISFDIEGA